MPIRKRLSTFDWYADVSYNEEAKKAFHKAAKKRLKALAEEMRLTPGSYEIRSNEAGIAVSGEITIHHEEIYVQISQGSINKILARTCKGMRNFRGHGPNNWLSFTLLDDIPTLAEKIKLIMISG